MNIDDVHGVQLLAKELLRDVERIAELGAARMQETLPAYAKVPRDELTPVLVTNTRNLLEAIRDPDADPTSAQAHYRTSGAARARQGITSDEMLNAWRIGLEVVREQADAKAEELEIGKDQLLEFVVATLRWGDIGMRASASAHHEAEIRELGRLVEQQAALQRVATLVARGCSPAEVFATLTDEVVRLLGLDSAAMSRYESDATMSTVAISGRLKEFFPIGSRWSLGGRNVSTLVFETGGPARIESYADASDDLGATLRERGLRSAVGTPIVVEGRLWGVMSASSGAPEPLPADTEARLASFTELAATAIANAESHAGLARLAEEQAALRRVATMVARECPPVEIFSKVAEEVVLLLGAEAALIQRYEPDGTSTVVGRWATPDNPGLVERQHVGPFRLGSRSKVDGDSVTALVYRTERAARFDDYEHAAGPIAADVRLLRIRSSVGSPIVAEGRLWGAIVAATSQAEPLPADAESRIAQFTELVATAISNVQARQQVQRLADEQAALRRVATIVARGCPSEEVFAAVAKEVGLLLGSEGAVIHRFEADGHSTVVGSWRNGFAVGSRFKLEGDSVTTLVYRTQRPARLDDPEHGSGSLAAGARQLGLRSAVGTPIVVNGRLWGAITAAASSPEPIPADAESRIAQFTELVATAIANVEVRSDLAASRARIVAAADEERRRVVRDLHDGAQQRLVHTIVTLKLAKRALAPDEKEVLVNEALRHAETATNELRELAHGILPSVLTGGGLRAGVGALASRMSIPVEIDVSVDRLPSAVEATAYLTVAEALTNVAKHSHADRATVKARLQRHGLQVEVYDDGVGGAQADGTGLVGLKDRLAVLDGSLRVESPPDGGTRIAASIPVVD